MKISRVFLSIFIIFHLWLVLVIPFQSNILKQTMPRFFYSYISIIGLNTPWNFFSPEPAPITIFEVEAYQDKNGKDEWKTFIWPPERSEFFFRETFYRKLFSSKALFSTEARWKVLAGYFCRRDSVSLITLRLKSKPANQLLDDTESDLKFHGEQQFLCEDL